MSLFEDASATNAPALSVSEISGAVKRVIEGEFGRVRVRGEVGRVSRPSSGHLYFDLKDDNACIAAVCWRTQAARLPHRPEEGMEIIVSGRLTTFPGASKYQLVVESVEPAGLGALMAMLEQRRKALAAEGLFDPARKRPLPSLPRVIGVVTSPSGAVIRDILHRLRDRFPTRVLIWPVAVQGAACAPEVAAAIAGFNALKAGGPVPRPDLIIVARGGGSVEDLWGFNDEAVVRAVAAGTIPLISAVGHETDTTLIDHAADLRAPTPTAAAELAVPVRAELVARLAEAQLRLVRGMQARVSQPRQRLGDLARAMGRPQAVAEVSRQRLDYWGDALEPALHRFTLRRRAELGQLALPPALLRQRAREARARLDAHSEAMAPALARRPQRARERLGDLGARLERGRARVLADARKVTAQHAAALAREGERLRQAASRRITALRDRLERLDRLRQTLGYRETLRRGFAVVHGPEGLVASAAAAAGQARVEIEFHDGRIVARPEAGRAKPAPRPAGDQGTLF